MTTSWNVDQVLALAPDAASVKAAKALTSAAKWSLLAYKGDAVWGHCKGSGAAPYQTRIDLFEPAFKCSCPSRKFPCKHALALLTLYIENRAGFAEQAQAPPWVQEWLDSRAKRNNKAARNVDKPPDPKAQAKRIEQRQTKILRGLDELERWLQDLVRGGFAELQNKSYSFWSEMAARLVDAQAPGLAGRVEQLAGEVVSGMRWAERVTESVGRLHLLIQAYRRIDSLAPGLQADVRSLIGWPQSKEEVLSGVPVEDRWAVLGARSEQDGAMITQRVWLHGLASGRMALILNFAHESNRSTLNLGWTPPSVLHGPLYFYPSAAPLRALPGELRVVGILEKFEPAPGVALALEHYKAALLKNPWLTQFPLLVGGVRGRLHGEDVLLIDDEAALLPLASRFRERWKLLALGGGHAVAVFGEWNGRELNPLGALAEGVYWDLAPAREAA